MESPRPQYGKPEVSSSSGRTLHVSCIYRSPSRTANKPRRAGVRPSACSCCVDVLVRRNTPNKFWWRQTLAPLYALREWFKIWTVQTIQQPLRASRIFWTGKEHHLMIIPINTLLTVAYSRPSFPTNSKISQVNIPKMGKSARICGPIVIVSSLMSSGDYSWTTSFSTSMNMVW